MFKKLFVVYLVSTAGFLNAGYAQAASIDLFPSTTSVIEGQTLTVDVWISGLDTVTDGVVDEFEVISSYEIDLLFDLDVLGLPVVTYGDSLGAPLSVPTTLPAFGGPGVNISDLSLLLGFELVPLQNPSLDLDAIPLPVGSVFLASLAFTPIAPGSGDIEAIPGFSTLGDFIPLFPGDVEGAMAAITVSPIPLPGALWLMMTGLLGLGAMARKKASTG